MDNDIHEMNKRNFGGVLGAHRDHALTLEERDLALGGDLRELFEGVLQQTLYVAILAVSPLAVSPESAAYTHIVECSDLAYICAGADQPKLTDDENHKLWFSFETWQDANAFVAKLMQCGDDSI